MKFHGLAEGRFGSLVLQDGQSGVHPCVSRKWHNACAPVAKRCLREDRILDELKHIRSKYVYGPARRVVSRFGFEIVRAGQAPEAPGAPARETFGFDAADGISDSRQLLLTPRAEELDVDDLLDFFEAQELPGICIPSVENVDLKVCFLQQDKVAVLNAIARFCAREGARLTYRIRNETFETTDVAKYLDDLSGVEQSIMTIDSLRCPAVFTFSIEFWAEEPDFYTSSGPNYLSRRLWKTTAKTHGFFEPGPIRDYSAMLTHPHESTYQFSIDLVFTWVNSEDPDWQKLYREHTPEIESDGTGLSRFHSRDELKYALRSWDTYAPFVRNIYVVSNCSPPSWLNIEEPRLTWVPHEDILPASSLPTFSSHAIETSLHRIPGIAEHFIYSNDDFLLTRQAHPSDFFFPSGIAKVRLEPYGQVNGDVNEEHPDYLNGARNANALIEKELGTSTTQLVTHSPQPLRKDVMMELESKFDEDFDRTAHNKFRAIDDVAVTGYLHAHYAIVTGRAVSDTTPVQLIQQNHRFRKILGDLVDKKDSDGSLPLSICLNDGASSHLNVGWNNAVTSFLDAFYPDASSFEK